MTTVAGSPLNAADAISAWEDVLTLVVEPESPRVGDRARARRLLSFLLQRAGVEEAAFWALPKGRRGRLFLSRYSRAARDIAALEISAFDLDKALKERFRDEPLTVGAQWHHGYWRSYFSHAAITHPANDGLREEFSTAWDIVRKHPAVVFRTATGQSVTTLNAVRLDLPMIVGPLPHSDGITMERAYLEAIASADASHELHTRSLLVMEWASVLAELPALLPHAANLLARLGPRDVAVLDARGEEPEALRDFLSATRVVELAWTPTIAAALERIRVLFPRLLVSVWMRYSGEVCDVANDAEGAPRDFWLALEQVASHEGVALIHYHSGATKSYRLTPRIDAYLKARFLRARVQLVSAGGTTDTQASAATVYESVLLGANGGAMTHIASIALAPGLIDVHHGADLAPVHRALRDASPKALRDLAIHTIGCWQHSILDFLSCMGIDDIQKTSGNTMAITMTEDWIRDVDVLATPEFGELNAVLNTRRVKAEPVPGAVRDRYRVSALLREVTPDLPLALAAQVLAHENVNFHLQNTNRNLSADFLDVIYRMAAGELPRAEDFFIESDMGTMSLDGVELKLSQASLRAALERLHREPELLDYISLAVPRGFLRPGAVPSGAGVAVHRAMPLGVSRGPGEVLAQLDADATGGFEQCFEHGHELEGALRDEAPVWLVARDAEGGETRIELTALGHGGKGYTVLRASSDGAVTLRREPAGGLVLSGFGFREPIWHAPVSHASISLGAASEEFLVARIEGNAGLAMTSSGEGGPIRLAADSDMAWESMQAASGHFGIHAADLRRVRDVEIKINQGAKPGKGGRLSGAKVTPTVSKARNIPAGTNALSPDPKHDIYSIEDMPAEVWMWLLYRNYCGIKITGSNYTRYVAAGMWSNFVVDYLLIDAGIGGSGNYHADSSHVGWPDIFRTILHTHHALVAEKVDLDRTGELTTIRDMNGSPFGAQGGTRLFASGGLRGELDMIKVLIAGADGLVEASIGKAVAFGCNQCGNCHLDCPRGGITTKAELTVQNDRALMRQRFRNWTALNMVKLAVIIDALNIESGALSADGVVAHRDRLIDDIRQLRGRTDLLDMPKHPAAAEPAPPAEAAAAEHDSCRVGSLAVSEPVTIEAIWESAHRSYNGGNNRGGGIDFAGFAPTPLRDRACLVFNTIGPDRADTMREMLGHLAGCAVFDALGHEIPAAQVATRLDEFRLPVRERYASEFGWRDAGLRENPGDVYTLFVEPRADVMSRYAATLLDSPHWLQRRTKYGDLKSELMLAAMAGLDAARAAMATAGATADATTLERLAAFATDVREEYFTALAHLIDSRYYRTHAPAGSPPPPGKYAAKRRGFVVSMGEDLAAVKMSGWTHTIPEYFDFDRFWANYPGAREQGGINVTQNGRTFRTTALHAHVWGMHHRYPTNSPAIDAEGRGNPAGAHPFKGYNVLLMHNGEQVAVDSTAPFLSEFGYVHGDESMGEGHALVHGDSVYERKALTDTEYAAYLVDFTRRVLGLSTEDASQVISPITGIDLAAMDEERRIRLKALMTNYVQLTPTGPYKFTIVESRGRTLVDPANGRVTHERRVGFRENMDIKFLRPHEIAVSVDSAAGGVHAVANGSEAKIADSMLRTLHAQGVLADVGSDLRFSMRPGGNPGRRDFGGVVEAFTVRGSGRIDLRNRFGESVEVERSGVKVDLAVPLERAIQSARPVWIGLCDERLRQLSSVLSGAGGISRGRLFGPDDLLPAAANELIEVVLDQARTLTFEDVRYLTELALPLFARNGDAFRAAALRVLTELRKRLTLCDLGGKALSSVEYLVDGGRSGQGAAEGGIVRVLDEVPALHEALVKANPGGPRYGRLTLATRDDLSGPGDAARDVLVIDFAGFESESFGLDSASRIVSAAVRMGWRNIIGYGFIGGPRYVGTNLAGLDGTAARGVVIELYGSEFGDFIGALLEGGTQVWVYGQGQSHVGMKADEGYLFVLQDALNTCMYAAHGGTISVWETGSRFAVAGQNKVLAADGKTLAQGFKSIHFGSPNEYAFEYLMAGGDNSLHVVMGLRKPNAQGELSLKSRPYGGKFFMSGAAAGRVFVFDPNVALLAAQYHGNVLSSIPPQEWAKEVAPFIATEAKRRGLPIRIDGEYLTMRLEGQWRRWRYDEAFARLVPIAVSKAAEQQGLTAPSLVQIVGE